MIWVIVIWLAIIPIAIPIIGRIAARDYRESPRKPGQMSAVTCGILWGIIWPVFILLYCGEKLWQYRPESGLIRKIVTGTTDVL